MNNEQNWEIIVEEIGDKTDKSSDEKTQQPCHNDTVSEHNEIIKSIEKVMSYFESNGAATTFETNVLFRLKTKAQELEANEIKKATIKV